jgi:hypothetical protein
MARHRCIFELDTTQMEAGCDVVIVMPRRERNALKAGLFGNGGRGLGAINEALSKTGATY